MLFLRRSLPILFALLIAAPACKKDSKSDDSTESSDDDSKKKKKKGDDEEDDDKKSKKKKKKGDDDESVKTASDDGEKPKKKKSAKKKVVEDDSNPLPDSWIRVYDDKLGYEFKVPAGTPKMKLSMSKGTAYYTTQTPKPHQIDLALAIFKDPTLNKDQVEARTKKLLENFGDLDVKIGNAKDMGHDYSLASFTSRMQGGKKNKGVVLVALDKTDNYVFYVSCEAADYDENKETIEHIWKSFEMESGGASGTDGSADPDEH